MTTKVNAEVIGEFLEEIDYAGAVNRDVLAAYAPFVAAAGKPGSARWRSAVALAAQHPGGSPPALEALQVPPVDPQRGTLEQRVTQLLREAGRSEPIAPETIEALRPLVQLAGIPGQTYWKLAVKLLGDDDRGVPSADQLQQRMNQEKARLQANRQRVAAEARARASADVEQASAYVAQVRAETGAGPTWRELSDHLDWPSEWPNHALEAAVRHLVKTGVLRCTRAPRSLDLRRPKETPSPLQ